MSGSAPVRHRIDAVDGIVERLGAGAVLLSDYASVRWIGAPSPGGASVLVSGGGAVVIDGDDPAGALARALSEAGVGPDDAVGVEAEALPVALIAPLGLRPCPDVTAQVALVRARKEPSEVALIAAAAQLADAGQGALRGAVAPGLTELELWLMADAAMRHARGGPVEAVVDLMAGERTELVGAPPGTATVAPGDAVLFDLAPRRDGYWADSCVTLCCREPSAALRGRHDVVRRALDQGLRAARPGVRASEVDRAMRAMLDDAGLDCPHHMGHGVGIAPQEPPWLVPDDHTVLEEGMVVALEPGAYADGFGVRLEHLALIGPDGAVPLTTHVLHLS